MLPDLEWGAGARRPGCQHDGQIRIELPQGFQELDTAHVRHVYVADDDVEGELLSQLDRDATVPRLDHDVACLVEAAAKQAAELGLVVDQEHPSVTDCRFLVESLSL